MYRCSKCKKYLPNSSFYIDKSKKRMLSAYCKKCSNDNRKKNICGSQANYYQANRAIILEKLRIKGRELKKGVLSHYSPGGQCCCVQCGEARIDCLSLDHINGGGNKHKETTGYGSNFYKWVIRNGFPDGLQTLCMNCQWVKRYTNKEHRNQYTKEVV